VSQPSSIAADRTAGGALRVRLSGDWITGAALPGLEVIEKNLAANAGVTDLTFDTSQLGRWDSRLVTFLFKCHELCVKNHIEFRTETLPAGLAKLLRLSAAVPEKKDAVRNVRPLGFLQRLCEFGISVWVGAAGMLRFVGQNVVALMKLVQGRAQFRWSDTFLAIQECGPEALGIVALINFLIGLILAFVGATELANFGASIYTADLVAVATVR